jgi:hypothetical protein
MWVEHHLDVIDTDDSGLSTAGYVKKAKLEGTVEKALEKRDVQWELQYAMDPKAPFDKAVLLRDGVVVKLGRVREASQ